MMKFNDEKYEKMYNQFVVIRACLFITAILLIPWNNTTTMSLLLIFTIWHFVPTIIFHIWGSKSPSKKCFTISGLLYIVVDFAELSSLFFEKNYFVNLTSLITSDLRTIALVCIFSSYSLSLFLGSFLIKESFTKK